jgi:hypothetical protein
VSETPRSKGWWEIAGFTREQQSRSVSHGPGRLCLNRKDMKLVIVGKDKARQLHCRATVPHEDQGCLVERLAALLAGSLGRQACPGKRSRICIFLKEDAVAEKLSVQPDSAGKSNTCSSQGFAFF